MGADLTWLETQFSQLLDMRLRFLQWRNHGKKNKRRGLCFAVVLEERNGKQQAFHLFVISCSFHNLFILSACKNIQYITLEQLCREPADHNTKGLYAGVSRQSAAHLWPIYCSILCYSILKLKLYYLYSGIGTMLF